MGSLFVATDDRACDLVYGRNMAPSLSRAALGLELEAQQVHLPVGVGGQVAPQEVMSPSCVLSKEPIKIEQKDENDDATLLMITAPEEPDSSEDDLDIEGDL